MRSRIQIGESLRDALNWMQDRLHVSRPIAEQTVISAIKNKTAFWDDGKIYIIEDDEELEKRKNSTVQSTQKSFNASKKWSRIHFRNQNRKTSRGKNSLKSIHRQAASKFSSAAEEMLVKSTPVLTPTSTLITINSISDDEKDSV